MLLDIVVEFLLVKIELLIMTVHTLLFLILIIKIIDTIKLKTLHAHDFIMTLLRHLLPSQFKIIRYYGFYRLKHSIHLKMVPLIKEHCRKVRKQLLKYEFSISMSFHRNPFDCPKCGTRLDFVLYIE